MLIFLILLYYK